mgnify:CR=1 FL=1
MSVRIDGKVGLERLDDLHEEGGEVGSGRRGGGGEDVAVGEGGEGGEEGGGGGGGEEGELERGRAEEESCGRGEVLQFGELDKEGVDVLWRRGVSRGARDMVVEQRVLRVAQSRTREPAARAVFSDRAWSSIARSLSRYVGGSRPHTSSSVARLRVHARPRGFFSSVNSREQGGRDLNGLVLNLLYRLPQALQVYERAWHAVTSTLPRH